MSFGEYASYCRYCNVIVIVIEGGCHLLRVRCVVLGVGVWAAGGGGGGRYIGGCGPFFFCFVFGLRLPFCFFAFCLLAGWLAGWRWVLC
ncbi:uncharacterized protein K452DRAFT_89179 [Aplosporella prunicola CBS 121167]|uniref:Uncharacterized protein n=1 Tax=Aplosporella prunicola CBS 121167 TaxID=1176127 RepID=A0A6A6B320_9PEZI|nr:uncharacterized protein K452DRAFT_89179 [Aplosporella prunicola CBS 121167]KAF2138612.1 hypothetical protein K452DRAFT_89179 [Aplosporella prunicola CBS 121167]